MPGPVTPVDGSTSQPAAAPKDPINCVENDAYETLFRAVQCVRAELAVIRPRLNALCGPGFADSLPVGLPDGDPSGVAAALTKHAQVSGWNPMVLAKAIEAQGALPHVVRVTEDSTRGNSTQDSSLLGPGAATIRADLFDAPPDPPAMVIEGFEPRDVGSIPGAGGTGKTTIELWLAIHRILGWSVFGREILRPGPVLYVSAEDSRERIAWRVYQLCKAMNLSRDRLRLILAGLYVEDLSATRWRLVQADKTGNLSATLLVDRLAELYAERGLSAAVLDPMVYFGPGERFVNDGEAELMLAGRALSRALECSVRFPHHTGKTQAREQITDQYAGRGGSAGADNARFVHVLMTHSHDAAFSEPAGISHSDTAAGRILRLHVAKLTDAKRPEAPFWIRREGWRFDWIVPRDDDPIERETAAIRELCELIRRAAESGVRHTRRSLEAAFDPGEYLRSRQIFRRMLHVAVERGHLVERELPAGERKGRRTRYLSLGSSM